jgi:threonine dehydratase
MRNLGADVRLVAGGYSEAESNGLAYAAAQQAVWISPYNDGQVIAGQATLALEILQELPDVPEITWVVPVGGGGLISGIAAALKAHLNERAKNNHRLMGVQSEASPFFHAIYHSGSQSGVIELPSLADGLSGPVENGSLTIPLVRAGVDGFLLVSEAEIVQAIAFAWERYQERIEGAAAVALAAVITGKITRRPALVVITGGNIQPEIHTEITHGHYSR